VLSSCSEDFDAGLVVAFEQSEQLAGDGASQAPFGVASALALGGAPGQVDAGLGVDAQAHQQDRVQMVCKARLSWRSPPRLSR
jgi:hypothetical protein